MTILALDLGTKTGWAINDDGVIRSGMEDFTPKKGDHIGKRYHDFIFWVADMIIDYKPEYIYYEMPHMRGRRATEVLHGYLTCLQETCYYQGADEPISVHSGTIKKFATGNGRASKEDMIEEANEFIGKVDWNPNYEDFKYKEVTDDNEADAICLLKYAESQLKEEK